MELLQLKYFCVAAKEESFSRAAEHFKVPQSNISRAVRSIERELGAPLFKRSANRIALSERGKHFYGYVKDALELLLRAQRSVEISEDEPKGEIRLLLSTCRRIATEAIENSIAKYPDITFSVQHGITRESFDFIVSDIPPTEKKYERILLTSERMMLAVPERFRKVAEGALASLPFISLGEGTRLHALTKQYCLSLGFHPNVTIQTDDPTYVRKYLEMGLGVAVWPKKSWGDIPPAGVTLTDVGFPKRDNYVFYESSVEIGYIHKLFLDILIDAFREK